MCFEVKRAFSASSVNQSVVIEHAHKDWGVMPFIATAAFPTLTTLIAFRALGDVTQRVGVFAGCIESTTKAEFVNG